MANHFPEFTDEIVQQAVETLLEKARVEEMSLDQLKNFIGSLKIAATHEHIPKLDFQVCQEVIQRYSYLFEQDIEEYLNTSDKPQES